jgi:ATP-dependent helicase/DNAse subunit B
VLWLGSPAEAELELASNTRGSLYHKTMELAVKQAIAEPNIREAVLARLDEAFAEAEKSDGINITKITTWELRRDEHLELLRKFVADECFVGEGVSVEAVEAEFDLTWKGLRLRGKIDRIDRTTDGLAAVDYKTGSAGNFAKDETGRLKLDVQMPVYSKAALPDLFKSETQFAAGSYLSFKDRKASKERDADLEAFIERLKADFARGNFAVEPDVDGKACEFCAYESVCRQGARLWRKPAE